MEKQVPIFDISKVLDDPEVLTGLSQRRYQEVRQRFSGTDISFLTIAVWSHTGATKTAVAKFLGRYQANVSRTVINGADSFTSAYKAVLGREPTRPLTEISDEQELVKRLPEASEYIYNYAAAA